MFNVLKSVFGTKNDRELKLLKPLVDIINSLKNQCQALSLTNPIRVLFNLIAVRDSQLELPAFAGTGHRGHRLPSDGRMTS